MAQSILDMEIHEQPAVVAELLQHEEKNVRQIAASISGKFSYALIAARGTSDNAARYAQYLLGAHNQIQVALATPSLFSIYKAPPDLFHSLVIGISQSGQSPDIISVLAEAHRQGRPTLAITNIPGSPLAQAADFVIPLHARQEKATAATKTYTTSLAALAMLSAALSGAENHFTALSKIPEMMEKTLAGLKSVIQHTERYRYMEHCAVLGRGFNYATAFEVALKVKELTRVVAEPYSSADFRHGPIATVVQGFPVILVATKGAISQDLSELINHLKRLKAELLVISDQDELLSSAHLPLRIPSGLPEWLTPLIAVVPGQLFAMNLAIARGLDPDHPAGIT